jgi:PDZ domain
MTSLVRGVGRFFLTGLVLALGTWAFTDPSAGANDRYGDGAGEVGGPVGPIGHLNTVVPLSHSVLVNGTLGYGPPGLYPGFYGFSLGYHPGYGYGGNALGVGVSGGYPCYGGPGYPIRYGYPHFTYPYYEGIGQLVFDPGVVISDLANPGDYGPYTGASAYAYTHPTYTAAAAATGSSVPGVSRYPDRSATNALPEATLSPREGEQPGPGAMNTVPAQDRYLGMDLEPATDPAGRRGLKIVNVLPSSTAERAGLNVGDIIYSANGHVTDQRGHLGWIIANAAPDNILTVTARKASDGKEQTIRIEMP